MNTYSRALRYISMKDVKQKHHQKLIERKIKEQKNEEEKMYISSVMKRKKYDWRRKLNEGMTSSGTFFTTLPATGDTDIVDFDVSNPINYQGYSNVSYGDELSFKTYGTNPYALTNTIDTTYSDTISFTGYTNPNFSTQSDLYLFWYNNDTDEFGDIDGISKDSTSPSTYNVILPAGARGPRVDFEFYQLRSFQDAREDFVGKPIYIDGQLINVDSNFSSGLGYAIYSLLVNYNNPAETRVNLGKNIMTYASQNPSTVSGYENTLRNPFYPGFPGPISGNDGDPRIDGTNGQLYGLKNNGWDIEVINTYYGDAQYTQQELIDLFYDTTLNGSQLYDDLREWDRLTNLANDYYDQYLNYFQQGDFVNANYYLSLRSQNVALATDRENAVLGAISAAETLPDSRWTDDDYEKVAEDVYDTYGNSTTYRISNLSTKRKTPMNIFVSLDSPEASSFIRTDPNMSNLSPEERLQKLKDMLEASDEYVMKILGSNFPGTGAVPPGEFDPYAQMPPGKAGDTPGVEIAQVQPIEPAQQRKGTTGVGVPDTKDNFIGPKEYQKMNYPKEWLPKQAKQSVMPMVASYEPEGQVISEKRKLKSPQELLNKIPGYYDGKPAPLGFPETPPPEMVNGMHPDLVDGKKVSDRFNRLDPESAKAMPPTGNPHIDKKIKAARKKPK